MMVMLVGEGELKGDAHSVPRRHAEMVGRFGINIVVFVSLISTVQHRFLLETCVCLWT
jgi:hypothetical protein